MTSTDHAKFLDRSRVARGLALLCVPLVTFGLAACGGGTDSDRTATSTSSAAAADFPYPPVQFRGDIAVPLSGADAEAAQFALDTLLLEDQWKLTGDESTRTRIHERVTYDQRPNRDGVPSVPETGGTLYRVVGVDTSTANQWTFSYCWYNTPGVYRMGEDGALVLSDPDWVYYAFRTTVAMTSEKSGTGATSGTPRLLVTKTPWDELAKDNDKWLALTPQLCEPYKPDPFVQQPPAPIPAGK